MRCTVRTTGQRSRHGRRRRGARRWPPRWLPGAAPATRSTSPGRSTQQRERAAQGHRPVVPLPRPGYGRRWRPVRAATPAHSPPRARQDPCGQVLLESDRLSVAVDVQEDRPVIHGLVGGTCGIRVFRMTHRVSRSGSVSTATAFGVTVGQVGRWCGYGWGPCWCQAVGGRTGSVARTVSAPGSPAVSRGSRLWRICRD